MAKRFYCQSGCIISCILIIHVFFNSVSAASGDTIVPVTYFNNSAEAILKGNYKEAEAIFDRFIRENPKEPAGPLM